MEKITKQSLAYTIKLKELETIILNRIEAVDPGAIKNRTNVAFQFSYRDDGVLEKVEVYFNGAESKLNLSEGGSR